MRKFLLVFLVFMGLGWTASAQQGLKHQAAFNTKKLAKTPLPDFEPYVKDNPSASAINKGADIVVGHTKFDVQTYGGTPRHIWAWDDGTMGIVWTMGMESDQGYPDRGTGYNYFDGNAWGPIPTQRIEGDERTGWPEISQYGENGEIVAAHAYPAGTIYFSYRENKGTGEWQHFTLESPVTPVQNAELVWPRITVTGADKKTVHVLCMVGWNNYEYEGLKMALTYSRTTDGGQTWDPEHEILDGMTSDDYPGIGADEYAWAVPHGDTIAFVVFNGVRDGFIMKSYDGGDSWQKITFYESPDPFFDGNSGDLPMCGGGDGSNAIAIDNNGMVHVAFGRQIHIDENPNDNTWSFYPYSDGMVYWNETMEPLDTADITHYVIPPDWSATPLYQHGQLAAYTGSGDDTDTIVGLAAYYASMTTTPNIEIREDDQEGEIVTIFYSGVALGYVNDELQQNYRHIYHVQSEPNNTWSTPLDLTGDVFHLASECVFPSSIAKNGVFHVTYQTDNVPGITAYDNTLPPVVNNIVYLQVMPLPVGVPEKNQVNFEVGQNRPNPAVNRTLIDVKAPKGLVELEVLNTLGQRVLSDQKESSGKYVQFNVNVADFSRGVYFYTVKFGDQSVTKKMIVK